MENIENVVETTEQSTDQYDAFMAGFDADETPETEQTADPQTEQAEEDAHTEETETTETEESGETADAESGANGPETTEPGENANAAEQSKEQAAPKSWQIKYMGETKTFSVEDITPEVLQKSMDYDRIRSKYDEAKPVMEMFSEFAKSAGMSVADYAKHVRIETKKASGLSEAEAKRTVELEEREAAIAANEEAKRQESVDRAARTAKVQADLQDFAKAFPQIYEKAKTDKTAIPQSVWEDVGRGLSLTAAYARFAVKQAETTAKTEKSRADVAEQGRRNAARSTGSMRSAGNDKKVTDAFLEGFGD